MAIRHWCAAPELLGIAAAALITFLTSATLAAE
jgi:hypothetical protein